MKSFQCKFDLSDLRKINRNKHYVIVVQCQFQCACNFEVVHVCSRCHIMSYCYVILRDDTHMTSMKIIQSSRPRPPPLVHLRPDFFPSLDLGRPILNQPPPHSPNDNQSVKRKHNPRMTIVCYLVLPSGRPSLLVSTH